MRVTEGKTMDYKSILRSFIIENFLYGDGSGFTDETSFLESGIVDSTGLLEIVSFLESEFGITVEDDELIPENFDCLVKLSIFLARKHKQILAEGKTAGSAGWTSEAASCAALPVK